jgi:cephalosporin hydroxylase
MFDRLVWKPDHMILDDLVFRLEGSASEDWNGGDHFRFHKSKYLIDQYAHFFSRRCDVRPSRVMELGIWDGGSIAFWYELFEPQKHVGVDIQDQTYTTYLRRYIESRGLDDRIKTYWNTDQADKARLCSIVETEFDGPLDLVIDDASHWYSQTRASFEALFPLLGTGGLYIIEDWAWGHWSEFFSPDHPWAAEEPLTRLVIELIEAVGTSNELILNIAVCQGFIAVERGPRKVDTPLQFNLENSIRRRGALQHSIVP